MFSQHYDFDEVHLAVVACNHDKENYLEGGCYLVPNGLKETNFSG